MSELQSTLGYQSIEKVVETTVSHFDLQLQALDETIRLLSERHNQIGDEIQSLSNQQTMLSSEINRLRSIRQIQAEAQVAIRTVGSELPPSTAPVASSPRRVRGQATKEPRP